MLKYFQLLKFLLRWRYINKDLIRWQTTDGLHTLAVVNLTVPDGDWLRRSDGEALKLFAEIAVGEHETR